MAVDTAQKRFSVITLQSPIKSIVPDGTIDQGDRQAIAGVYSGILAATPSQGIGGQSFRWTWDQYK